MKLPITLFLLTTRICSSRALNQVPDPSDSKLNSPKHLNEEARKAVKKHLYNTDQRMANLRDDFSRIQYGAMPVRDQKLAFDEGTMEDEGFEEVGKQDESSEDIQKEDEADFDDFYNDVGSEVRHPATGIDEYISDEGIEEDEEEFFHSEPYEESEENPVQDDQEIESFRNDAPAENQHFAARDDESNIDDSILEENKEVLEDSAETPEQDQEYLERLRSYPASNDAQPTAHYEDPIKDDGLEDDEYSQHTSKGHLGQNMEAFWKRTAKKFEQTFGNKLVKAILGNDFSDNLETSPDSGEGTERECPFAKAARKVLKAADYPHDEL